MSLKTLFSKKKKQHIPKCICGEQLVKTTPNAFYANKICDGCYKACNGDDTIYNCPTQTGSVSIHPHGYDICEKCAQNNYVPLSNTTSFMTLRQMGYGWDESLLTLELVDGNVDKAIKILNNFKLKSDDNDDYKALYDEEHSQMISIQTKYQQLESALSASKIQIAELFDTANKADQYEKLWKQEKQNNVKLNDKLQTQLRSAKDEINQLLDDKKEMELVIKEMKKENESLKKRNIDPSDFMNWNHEQILLWINSIDGGHFNKYCEVLKKELTECQMKGSDLLQLNTNDIRGLGIKVFSDAKKLEKYIQELINKYSNNSKINVSVENEGQYASTAYI